MRLMFISCSFPDKPDVQQHGLYNRMRTLVSGLAASGAELTCFFYVPDPDAYKGAVNTFWHDRMQKYFGVPVLLQFAPLAARNQRVQSVPGMLKGTVSAFYQENYIRQAGKKQTNALKDALAQRTYDLILVHRLASMPPVLQANIKMPPVILDLDDIEHVSFMRDITQPPVWRGKYLRFLQIPALYLAERRAIRLAEKTLVCSYHDVLKLRQLAQPGKIVAWPNAVAMPTVTAPSLNPNLLFLGSLTYNPNIRAVEYLLDEVWPLIKQKVPDATLTIGGIHPERIRHFLNPPNGVDFAGFIPSLDFAYENARAVVCTILSGGGTRVKIVEAAAYGRAVVSTTIGAEGLELNPGTEILIANHPALLAEQCVRLLVDYEFAKKIGMAARNKCETLYDRKIVINQLADLVKDLTGVR